MEQIKIRLARSKDKNQLLDNFKHYNVNEIIKNRVDCYTSHNFTVIAKIGDELVGILQWYVKEDPKAGVVEFEEVYVSENHRGKGIASSLMGFAIRSVKEYFKKHNLKLRKIFLFVSKNNKPARALYEKYGFNYITGIGPLFY